MNKIKIDMQLNAKDIWLFSMYHSNRGFLLIFNVLFTIVMYYYMITSWNTIDIPRKILFLALANMFLIIQPAMLYLKSAKPQFPHQRERVLTLNGRADFVQG